MAAEGRTAEQMKAVSGHQITSALQVYVNNSKIQKEEAAARSVSLNPVSVSAAAPAAVSFANAHHGADSSQQPHKRMKGCDTGNKQSSRSNIIITMNNSSAYISSS